MKVKVQYLGQVKVIINRSEEEVGLLSEATVQDLMQQLSTAYGKAFDTEVFAEPGKTTRDDLVIAVNGRAIKQLDSMNTRLKQGDVVTLFPIFPGGG